MKAPDDTPRSIAWIDVFPILRGHQDAIAWQTACVTSGHLDPTIQRTLLTLVPQLVLNATIPLPFWECFPLLLSEGKDIPWSLLDTRSINCLGRIGIETLPQLLDLTVLDLYGVRNAGATTFHRILRLLTQLSIDSAFSHAPSSAPAFATAPKDQSAGTTTILPTASGSPEHVISQERLLEAFHCLAEWHCLRGAAEAPLVSARGLEGSPSRVTEAWQLLQSLSATDLIDPDRFCPATLLDNWLSTLSEKQVETARARLFAESPETLEDVGNRLGVTRERIRQIANDIIHSFTVLSEGDGLLLSELSRAVCLRIGLICPLEHLLRQFPGLEERLTIVNAPAWRVLDRLDVSFEIEDGWAAVPTISAAIDTTRQVIDCNADQNGLALIDAVATELGLAGQEQRTTLTSWLKYAKCLIFNNYVTIRQFTIPDWAFVILEHAGSPLSVDDITTRLPVQRTAASVRNALSIDSRFIRTDRDVFGLRDWGGTAYSGIRDAISAALDASGGRVALSALIASITSTFSVSEASVRAYAQAHPFETRDGFVKRRRAASFRGAATSRTRRLYRTGDGWALRFSITPEHLRGSGSALPSALASEIGLRPGDFVELPSLIDTQSISWKGPQPSLGSIRRLLGPAGLSEGDLAFALFKDNGEFQLRRIPLGEAGGSGLGRALALSCLDVSSDDPKARDHIARALGLSPSASWTTILSAARARGEDDLAEALSSGGVLQPGDIDQAPDGAEITTDADILDLLR